MCGIVGYVGKKQALPVLLKGLKALEYRGYDSAGVVLVSASGAFVAKEVGRVAALEKKLESANPPDACMGIAHTRWATHGAPTETNAHPHRDCAGKIFAVHNGIIENYRELRTYLTEKGHSFVSETDTEVVPHLIEEFVKEGKDFKTAFMHALALVRGAYALVVVSAVDPETVYAAKLSSPLVIGIGDGETFVASDPSALVGSVSDVVYPKDGEAVVIQAGKVSVIDTEMNEVPFEITKLEWTLEQAQKGDFPHFMLKEIFEGPDVLRSTLRGRLLPDGDLVRLGGVESVADTLAKTERILILACGTSYYAGLIAEYFFEEIAGIPCEVHLASEFRYREEPLPRGTIAIAVSQSGETADTLAAIRKVKEKGIPVFGVVNTVGSTISRETDAGVYNHAGPEIGVASTKAFLSQITVLLLLAVKMSKNPKYPKKELLDELRSIPKKMEDILAHADAVKSLAAKYSNAGNFLFLGRRYGYPVALEGALKLKEVSYIHAEGYGAGEMKHGPIAMVSPDFPVIAVVPRNSISEKMYSNMEEVRAREGRIFSIATEGDSRAAELSDDVFFIPATLEPLEPFLAVIPLQLFAYYAGVARGYDVDKPRNLAKSVTVE